MLKFRTAVLFLVIFLAFALMMSSMSGVSEGFRFGRGGGSRSRGRTTMTRTPTTVSQRR